MTNDRRKTFNTPLEFWQWAIQFPGKRKARATGTSHNVLIVISEFGFPYLSGSVITRDNVMVPLTAVEDEHGPIEEQKIDALANSIALIGCISKEEVASILTAIRKEIDERIAAASVERFKLWEDKKKWCWDCDYRLKPKGDK